MSAAPQPKIALVIGSGGLRCVSAFGALAVLQRRGIGIDVVVACSGGAVVGYWIAAGRHDIAQGIACYTTGMERGFEKLSYRQVLRGVFPRWFGYSPKFGLMQDQAFNRYMAHQLKDACFEDLPTPLHLVATDVHSGEQVVLSRGPLFGAMRATMAIPLVLPPWEVQGRLLMDGAVCNPLPVDVAIREGADIILAMGFEDALQPALDSGVAQAKQVLSVASNHLLRAQFAFQNIAHHAEIIAVMPDFGQKVGLRDTHLVEHLVRQGELATEREMPYLLRLLKQRATARAGAEA